MLNEDQRERIGVVLVSPRNPLNIGAAARAMANFGFQRLSVVAPFEAHWREARSAIGAPDLLQNAIETSSLAEALSDCTLVAGTGTLTYRKPEQKVVVLPALGELVEQELARGSRVALVFGPEKHGLTREELGFCHVLVEIPTDARQPSMNLGQAVAVCLYELAIRPDITGNLATESRRRSATSEDLELLASVAEEAMSASDYRPGARQQTNRHELRLLLRRLAPTERDARRILGVFRRILWRLRRDR
ncbi:MAG: TrmH family RNA methyltransferase [Terracidiphilus sp.]